MDEERVVFSFLLADSINSANMLTENRKNAILSTVLNTVYNKGESTNE